MNSKKKIEKFMLLLKLLTIVFRLAIIVVIHCRSCRIGCTARQSGRLSTIISVGSGRLTGWAGCRHVLLAEKSTLRPRLTWSAIGGAICKSPISQITIQLKWRIQSTAWRLYNRHHCILVNKTFPTYKKINEYYLFKTLLLCHKKNLHWVDEDEILRY